VQIFFCTKILPETTLDEFPIRVLAELSDIPASTLRAWERRYHLLNPKRAASGHRLYTQADLQQIKRVLRQLEDGKPIREAARLVKDGLDDTHSVDTRGDWSHWIKRMLSAIGSYDPLRLDSIYNEALSLYPMDLVSEHLILPVLAKLGENWQARDGSIAEEHFFSAYLRNKLGARLHHESQRARGRRLLLTSFPGEFHELGLLMFALGALGRGYRVIYFGPSLPLAQIRLAVKRTSAQAVILSSTQAPIAFDELSQLVSALRIPVAVGGRQSQTCCREIAQSGAHNLGNHCQQSLHLLEKLLPAHGTH
jgi:DNA-binding transcriptional MerR regulator